MNHTSSRRSPCLSLVFLTLATTLLLAGTCLAQGTFVSFDGPNAGTASGNGTFPAAINRFGGIALTTTDDSGTTRAYVRHHRNGTYLQVKPPNALATYISGLNSKGQVAGSFVDASRHTVGYFRNVDGTYVILNPPGSTGLTNVAGINEAGQVAGTAYVSGVATPFFWDPAQPNNYVTYQIPGESFVNASALNDSGQIAGTAGTNTQSVGYLRQPDGTISTFTLAPYLTASTLFGGPMNKWGTIVGGFFDSNGSDSALFLRYSGGGQKYVFGASHGGFGNVAVNDNGVVVGTEFLGDTNYGNAFSFDRTLKVTMIPVPFPSQGSTANGVNNAGQIVGTYIDANGASHGWIYLP